MVQWYNTSMFCNFKLDVILFILTNSYIIYIYIYYLSQYNVNNVDLTLG